MQSPQTTGILRAQSDYIPVGLIAQESTAPGNRYLRFSFRVLFKTPLFWLIVIFNGVKLGITDFFFHQKGVLSAKSSKTKHEKAKRPNKPKTAERSTKRPYG